MVRAAWMEKIMSKTKDTSRLATFEDHDMKSTAASDCSLQDAELTDLSGGRVYTGGGFPIGQVYRPTVVRTI
jgi:hypothetical protein